MEKAELPLKTKIAAWLNMFFSGVFIMLMFMSMFTTEGQLIAGFSLALIVIFNNWWSGFLSRNYCFNKKKKMGLVVKRYYYGDFFFPFFSLFV